jgi:RNA polymerase sigma factor (sigma-70 family)
LAIGNDTYLKMNDTDQQLLQRYTQEHAEDAFAEIVRRHVNLVYSAALRQVQSPQLAKDVSQAVFTDLARNAGALRRDSILSAWLYEVTRRTAIDLIRKEARRQLREQVYTEMNAINATPEEWRDITPHLDAAMEELDKDDRAAVLLRFFENKSLREVGEELGVSDDAARKRVGRAVERLREFLSKRGVTAGAAGLVILISDNAVQAAPGELAAGITGAALAGAPVAAATVGVAKIFTATALQKVLIVASLGVLTAIVILIANHPDQETELKTTVASLPATAAIQNQTSPPDTNATLDQVEPDVVSLLQGIVRARQQIRSGSFEFQFSVERFRNGRKDPQQMRLLALFDDSKLRFESFGHEYSYAFDEDPDKQKEIVKRADSMDRESAIRAGLTIESTAHHTMINDGTAFFDHYQSDHQSAGVSIRWATNGTGNHIFDPRCIGLASISFLESTPASLVYTKGAKFIAEENLDGIPAFHVRAEPGWNGPVDYWIDKNQPERLLQVTRERDIVKSKYDASNLADPIPVEVNITRYHNGELSDISQLMCSSKIYNTPVDPQSFTLAGLGMAVGTEVNDDRIYRRIGYWTGSGLSEDLPSKQKTESQPAPRLEEMLAVLEKDPASTNALQSAIWIILNTPDGPAVQQASEVIEREHVTNTNLVFFVQELDRARPSSARVLLGALLQNNPSLDVRGNACFTLATLWKEEAKYGRNKDATEQAIKNYQRVIEEFSSVKQRGYSLAELAKPELMELQKLTIGKPAPDTEGVDLNGQPMRLSDYRGKVTVVVFWSAHFSEASRFNKLAEQMAGKPFALIGVNCDSKASKKEESWNKVTWPCFKDGRDGPIAKLWNVQSWTDTWVLDRRGVIRYRDVRDSDITDAVNKLLEE